MKHYFVTASFKNDNDGQFITQFDFFSDELNFVAIDEALSIMLDDLDLDGLKDFCRYDLVHFSISTF